MIFITQYDQKIDNKEHFFQNHPLDVSYFDTVFTEEPIKLTPVHNSFLDNVQQTQFKGFSYTNKLYCD